MRTDRHKGLPLIPHAWATQFGRRDYLIRFSCRSADGARRRPSIQVIRAAEEISRARRSREIRFANSGTIRTTIADRRDIGWLWKGLRRDRAHPRPPLARFGSSGSRRKPGKEVQGQSREIGHRARAIGRPTSELQARRVCRPEPPDLSRAEALSGPWIPRTPFESGWL